MINLVSPVSRASPSEQRPPLPEVWGGVECTCSRVGDQYFDQLDRSRHTERASDLELFASLGLAALRHPVLWERTMPSPRGPVDWSWPDRTLPRLRDLGIRPIVGLLHHGSGPPHTSLLRRSFAAGLAQYARRVAERYPWVEDYTPVNEPLTTARFSTLYGHWYPHRRSARAFTRAVLNQCRATVAAMRAVREVNPDARLVQTEDLARVHATAALSYQAAFENERRWLTFDLLCGRVDRQHPLWSYLTWAGASEAELEEIRSDPCPPGVIGLNHYLTSERFLDERLDRYPAEAHGGNGRHRYADVEAVRVIAGGPSGPRALLREAWERYGLPLAVTEVHLGCTREEQLRWLLEVWNAACDLRREGVDVRAVTAWALLGSFDWPSLTTRTTEHYEPGVFDLRGRGGTALRAPRPTALAHAVRELAVHGTYEHPVLDGEGWWGGRERLLFTPADCAMECCAMSGAADASARDDDRSAAGKTSMRRMAGTAAARESPRRLLITGAAGAIADAIARACAERGLAHYLVGRQDLDSASPASVAAALREFAPWAVVHAAEGVSPEHAERDPDRARREICEASAVLAEACARFHVGLLAFSSSHVFEGSSETTSLEDTPPSAQTVYGRSRVDAERSLRRIHPDALVVRTAPWFGPAEDSSFLAAALGAIAEGRPVAIPGETGTSVSYLPDVAHAALDLLVDAQRGIWHLVNVGTATPVDLVRRAAQALGLDTALVLNGAPVPSLDTLAWEGYGILGSDRGALLPSLDCALDRYVVERPPIPLLTPS